MLQIFKLCNSANLQKIQVSSSLSLPQDCSKSEGLLALLSWAESKATYVSLQQEFLVVESVKKKTKKKVNQKCKLLKRVTYRPSPATMLKFDWGGTCTQNTVFQRYKIEVQGAQFYRNSKWLCGSWSTRRE